MIPIWTVIAPLLVAYGVTFVWVWDSWMLPDSFYSHGPLVIVLALFLAWMRREQWRSQPGRFDVRGFWLLAPALFIHLAGAALTIDSVSAASLCLAIPGAVWLAYGGGRAKALATILILPAFAMPLPMFVSGTLAFELKEFAVTVGLELANAVGVGAERHGTEIHVAGQTRPLLVADPCSGLRSLVALTTLGYCFAFFFGSQVGAWRLVPLLLALPIAVGGNVLRIAVICWLAEANGVRFAAGTGHDLVTAGVWVLAIALLVAVDVLLSRFRRARGAP